MDDEFCCGEPKAAIGHGSQPNGQTATATGELFPRLPLLFRRLCRHVGAFVLGGFPLGLLLGGLLFGFLEFEAMDSICFPWYFVM